MYSRLIQLLEERLTMALPSAKAHDPLRAIPVGDAIPRFEHKLPPKLGSVLILLFEDAGRIKFPLIKRAEYNGAHSGQISLPGGKVEPGEDSIQTALRECEEEIGVPGSDITVIGRLSEFHVIPSNFLVTPVVATTKVRPAYNPDPHEVSRVIEADLDDLIREDAIQVKEIVAGGRYRMNAPHFEIDREIVWGATAMMLNELRYVIREVIQ